MSEGLWLGISLIVGMALGGIYFGGLWWTVNRLAAARSPGLLVLVSLLVRSAVVLGALYTLADGRWLRIVVAMVGFIGVRIAFRRALGPERLRAGTEIGSDTGS